MKSFELRQLLCKMSKRDYEAKGELIRQTPVTGLLPGRCSHRRAFRCCNLNWLSVKWPLWVTVTAKKDQSHFTSADVGVLLIKLQVWIHRTDPIRHTVCMNLQKIKVFFVGSYHRAEDAALGRMKNSRLDNIIHAKAPWLLFPGGQAWRDRLHHLKELEIIYDCSEQKHMGELGLEGTPVTVMTNAGCCTKSV